MFEKYDRYRVLEEAQKVVTKREKEYGSPTLNYERQAQIATIILASKLRPDFTITASDMLLLNLLAIKGSRLIENPAHTDSAVDSAGYSALLAEVA